jgi:hypothetical protein
MTPTPIAGRAVSSSGVRDRALPLRVALPFNDPITSDVGGGGPASPREPPFRRELPFVGVGQATWLVPRRGVTVAGQRRIATGLRWLYTGREYVPDRERIRPAPDARRASADAPAIDAVGGRD